MEIICARQGLHLDHTVFRAKTKERGRVREFRGERRLWFHGTSIYIGKISNLGMNLGDCKTPQNRSCPVRIEFGVLCFRMRKKLVSRAETRVFAGAGNGCGGVAMMADAKNERP